MKELLLEFISIEKSEQRLLIRRKKLLSKLLGRMTPEEKIILNNYQIEPFVYITDNITKFGFNVTNFLDDDKFFSINELTFIQLKNLIEFILSIIKK